MDVKITFDQPSCVNFFLVNRGQNSVKHFAVTQEGNKYSFGMATFANVTEFIDHFNSQPLLAGESGNTDCVFRL
jgi:hypothetical protein